MPRRYSLDPGAEGWRFPAAPGAARCVSSDPGDYWESYFIGQTFLRYLLGGRVSIGRSTEGPERWLAELQFPEAIRAACLRRVHYATGAAGSCVFSESPGSMGTLES